MLRLNQQNANGRVRPLSLDLEQPRRGLSARPDCFTYPVHCNTARSRLVLGTSSVRLPFLRRGSRILRVVGPNLSTTLHTVRTPVNFYRRIIRILGHTVTGKQPDLRRLTKRLLRDRQALRHQLTSRNAAFDTLLGRTEHRIKFRLLTSADLRLGRITCLLNCRSIGSCFQTFQR